MIRTFQPSICFRLKRAFNLACDRQQKRALAINSLLTPMETSRGTQSMGADAAIPFPNAVVKVGSDDRHFARTSLVTDIPLGVVLNDTVTAGDVGSVRKQIALFGLYPDSLPGIAAGAIPVWSELVCDLANPGYVKALPSQSGTYIVFGRARLSVAEAGDPVSIVHAVPYTVVVG